MTHSLLDRYRPGQRAVPLVVLALALLAALQPLSGPILDNRQVLSSYAAQFSAGHGLVFNPGERVLLVASPLYMLLEGAVEMALPWYFAGYLFPWLHFVALLVSANSLFRVAQRAGLGVYAAGAVAVLCSFSWPLLLGRATAFPLMTALCLLALDLALSSRWSLAGLVLSAAILCSPEAFLLAIPLLLLAVNKKAGRRFALGLLIPLALAVIALRAYYGPTLWDGLLILKPSPSTLETALPWLASVPVLALAAWGWYRERSREVVSVVGAWAMLHLLIIGGLLRVQAGWQYAPLAGATLLLAAAGLQSVSSPVRRAGFAVVAALVALSTFSAIQPIRPEQGIHVSGPFSSIGVMNKAQALNLSRTPDQSVIAFDGQLQPDLKAMIERGDTESMLIRYAPDILITNDSGRILPKDLASGAWARLDYRLTDSPDTYRRYSPIGSFVDRQADVPYGPDIRLVGYALDQPSLRPGQLVRVRLDWEMAQPASKPITVDLWLESGDYVFAHATDEYDSSVFEAGRWSTYHTLLVSKEAWPGLLTLRVGVIVSDGVVGRAGVTRIDIAP